MKLKEYPLSLSTARSLRKLPLAQLHQPHTTPAPGVTISLTSIPSRLNVVHLTIRSLLAQSRSAERVVLWLHESLLPKLPEKLSMLIGPRFEVLPSKYHFPHRKLIESLRQFPGETIVTADDDVMYPEDWLERLLEEHQKHPCDIVAHECRKISRDTSGQLTEYRLWSSEAPGQSHVETLAIGYGGVLYPPQALAETVLDIDLFTKLAPRVDDLWFKAMSLINQTATRRTENPRPKPVPVAFSQRIALKRNNIRHDANREQWKILAEHFKLDI